MAQFLCNDIVKTKETQGVGIIVTVREDQDKDRYLVEFDGNSATRTFFLENELQLVSLGQSVMPPPVFSRIG